MELKYPIGKFIAPSSVDLDDLKNSAIEMEHLGEDVCSLIKDWSEDLYLKSYRPEGWNGRQLVHHLFDSHSNALNRIKLTLTTEKPVIFAYDENKWATLSDNDVDPMVSAVGLVTLQKRMAAILKSLTETEWNKAYWHPEYQKHYPLYVVAKLYQWHGKHHLEHLKIIALS